MGSVLSSVFGTKDDFHAQQPLGWDYESPLLDNQKQIYQNQNGLAQALQAQMNGTGPNPAQIQYQKNMENSLANTQGMIASQRGLNPALASRLGANASTNSLQQASMGSALLQQQQQIAAAQQLGGLYGQQQQGNLAAQGLYTQGVQGANGINAGVAAQNSQTNAGLAGGLMNAAGGIGSSLITSGGRAAAGGGASLLAGGAGDAGGLGSMAMLASHGAIVPGKANVNGDSPENDTVNAKLSPGEIVIPRSKAHDPEKAKEFIDHLLKHEKKSKAEYGDVLKARKKAA